MKAPLRVALLLLALALLAASAAAGVGTWKQYLAGRRDIAWLPPRFDPTRSYALTYWDYHLPGTAGQQWVTDLLAEFQRRYPNVRVEHRLLYHLNGQETVQTALQAGTFPDVYAGPPAGFLLDSGLLASPDPYLERAEAAAYPPHLWPAAPAAGQGWRPERLAGIGVRRQEGLSVGLPRWVVPDLWAANPQALRRAGLDPEAVAAQGWTWAQFFDAAQRAGGGFFASDTPLAVLQQVLAGHGVPHPFTPNGEANWNDQVAGAAAQVLERLRPRRQDGGAMLGALFTRRAAVVGRVGLWLLPLAAEQRAEVMLLPPPHAGTDPVYSGRLHMVFVLSTAERRAQLPAAMELARFLSQEGAAQAAARAGAIPLHAPARAAWLAGGSGPPAALVEHYLAHAAAPPLLPATVAERERRLLQAAEETADRLWRGEVGHEELRRVLTGGAGGATGQRP